MKESIKKILPSPSFRKRIGIILLLVLVVYVLGILIPQKQIFQISKTDKASPIIVSDLVDTDSDSDGVPDWQETIWGLDPNNPDTNGDGISDKTEVDKQQSVLGGSDSEQGTRTDRFAEEVVKLVSTLQASGNLNDKNQEAIVEQISNYSSKPVETKIFTISDLLLVPETAQSKDQYIRKIALLTQTYPITSEDIDLLLGFDPDQIDALRTRYAKAEKKYELYVEKMKDTPVFDAIAFEHLKVMNGLQKVVTTYRNYSVVETDTLLTLQTYAQVENNMNELNQALKDFSSRLQILYNID